MRSASPALQYGLKICSFDRLYTVEKVDFHATGKSIYLACCHSLDVVPASYFIRHINDSNLQMAHHGVGVLGAKAMAIPLVVSMFITDQHYVCGSGNWCRGR